MFLRNDDWHLTDQDGLTDRRSVGQSVLVSRPVWVSWPDSNYSVTITVLSMSDAPFWRQVRSVICRLSTAKTALHIEYARIILYYVARCVLCLGVLLHKLFKNIEIIYEHKMWNYCEDLFIWNMFSYNQNMREALHVLRWVALIWVLLSSCVLRRLAFTLQWRRKRAALRTRRLHIRLRWMAGNLPCCFFPLETFPVARRKGAISQKDLDAFTVLT
jgi:hypothetical protein